MKNSILFMIFIIIFTSSVYAENNAKDVEGFWAMPEKPRGKMKVAKIIVIDNKVYAYGIALHDDVKSTLDIHNPDKSLRDKDLKGLIFIYDIVFKDGEWQTGRIYHIDQGSTYYAKISLSEDKKTLFLKASLDKRGIVGATVEWTRLSKEESNKYTDIPVNKLRTIEGKGI
ncbi:DUF2147 domain-containing protein [Brachyspira hampsonii]|uniref:DUF2147 domain-containing protein n=2 Tax=Brachyspira hampsonii TaxID=1287055 RepID=A0AAC9XJP4_9SPIR|nr:DUF2147 domain-containing protein [Brachyspira hampsonii]ASJ20443.1 hypothetical protein BHAMNSH16_01705 [Brachyspira hampsonii]ELV04999.1 hypothetical protein H263_12809 [Brachyspira hampsonii 30599]MBW5410246.1 DUF2147 domain-containing protein [Brachyspira hampsonii]OEJ16654.1 hypothetical protein A9496_12950 [Brachyspira hampsonii]